LNLFHHIRYRERFSGAGNAKQGLKGNTRIDTVNKLLYGLRLVTGGQILRRKFESHLLMKG
jgi:hypothetical protein